MQQTAAEIVASIPPNLRREVYDILAKEYGGGAQTNDTGDDSGGTRPPPPPPGG